MKSLNVCIPVSPSLFWPNSETNFIKSKSRSVFAWWSSLEIEFERQMGSIVKIQVPRKLWGKERSRRSDLCRGLGFRCGDMFLHLPLLKATQTQESGITYSPKPTSHTNEDENMLWKDLSLWMIKKEACTQGKLFLQEEKWMQASAKPGFIVGQPFPRCTPNNRSCKGGCHSSALPPAVLES